MDLRGTEVYLRVSTALQGDYDLISVIQSYGLRVMVDMRFLGTAEELEMQGMCLLPYRPEIVTVSCASGAKAMRALKEQLPQSEIVGITVPAGFGQSGASEIFYHDLAGVVDRMADAALEAGIGGLVCSAQELGRLSAVYGDVLTLNVDGLAIGQPVDQVLKAGATRVIVSDIVHSTDARNTVTMLIEEVCGHMMLEGLERRPMPA